MTQVKRSWAPLLDGVERDQAIAAIERIAADIREQWEAVGEAMVGGNGSVGGGSAGIALFFAYKWSEFSQEEDHRMAMVLAQHSMGALQPEAALYGGFSGTAWAARHLSDWILEPVPSDEDPFEEIDAELLQQLGKPQWPGHYDLIIGLAGLAVYALESVQNPASAAMLSRIVAHLTELARDDRDGVTWYTPAAFIPPQERDVHRDLSSVRNLGVAHGVPGVIAVLKRIAMAEIEASSSAEKLAGDALSWLIARCDESPEGLPAWVSDGLPPRPARLAWCYGDPGVAATLSVAESAEHANLVDSCALRVARRAAARPVNASGVRDGGLCHGSAGLAHIFNRLFRATGDPQLGDAAREWFRCTLRLQSSEGGVGGYRAWGPSRVRYVPGEFSWQDDPGFLTGAAGIGLALLAAIGSVEPVWDRLLLASN
jgi:lantibiotic modifying enzyme